MAWRLPFFQLTVVVALTRSANEDSRDVISCVAVECDGFEDTVSLLMTVPQNPEKSNNALGPATGGGSGGGQLAQLGQVSNFLSKSSEPDRMPHPDHFDETWDRLKNKTAKLPLCRAFPKYCDVKSVTYKVEVLAASMMWESLLGVGGAVVILQILMFYIAGVCWNTGLLGRLWPRVFGADGSDERGFSTPTSALDPAEPHLAGWASWLAPPQLAWPMKTWCQWWQLGPRLSRPIATMQLYVCCLLLVEVLALVTPNSCVLATAEMVGFVRKYPRHFNFLPHFGEWFMPNFEDNVDAWVSFLIFVRRLLVVSWSLFILLPQKRKGLWQLRQVALGVSYTCGALAYTYLSMIELTYQPSHTVQGTTLFVFSAMFVVPFLETNPMAGNWLRKFLLLNVVIPSYWFAGLSKIRWAASRV
ncbi:unnamed protein product [Durusdinium trenchii]|uniref:Uncharacterized protein n=1 Tax=Durusdinium trenchii TaxID=1381693 RepID=A0ABP0SQ40_9DINO